jgi:hypothetical protein
VVGEGEYMRPVFMCEVEDIVEADEELEAGGIEFGELHGLGIELSKMRRWDL